jgi:nicotinate-nucleotide pyrophosphorylase (carboxylating)
VLVNATMASACVLTTWCADNTVVKLRLQGHRAQVLDTRKTIPGLRLLDKWAVLIGGGVNHRMGLYDMLMIKDNHIAAAGGISAAVSRAQVPEGHASSFGQLSWCRAVVMVTLHTASAVRQNPEPTQHVQEYMAANELELPVEVEASSLGEVAEVLRLLDGDPRCCVTRIMLDNMAKYDSQQPGERRLDGRAEPL